jgi:FdhD protein
MARVLVHRIDGDVVRRAPDDVIVEEPLEIRLDGHTVTTTMRTPGHDFELAVGLCFTDGLLAGAPVLGARYCTPEASGAANEFNVVTVETGHRAPVPTPRLTTTTSSCGLCGTATLDDLRLRLRPLPRHDPFPISVLAAAPERIGSEQELFGATGGVHAAAAFDRDGTTLVLREDVGRHNAVDKVVGHLVMNDRLDTDLGLYVSGRASFEIVQKAWAAGFVAVVAVSAPSKLAVDTARAAGMTLAGFARGRRINLYAPDELDA